MLGEQRGSTNFIGEKGGNPDRSLMFFPKGMDMIGEMNQVLNQTQKGNYYKILFVCEF